MSSLVNSARLSNFWLKNNGIMVTSIRNHWNKDYKPGPYPKNEAEWVAAAEKYGIPCEEYKPYPDDGQGRGDYPELPMISAEVKDPFYPWDSPELKRNYNETLHAEFDLLREDRYNVNAKLKHPIGVMAAQFFGVMFASFGLYWLAEHVKTFPPVIPKQYPGTGKVHYTFEPNVKS